MEKKAWLICICCLCCMCGVSAPKKNNFSVKRGVNISHWLSQSNVRGENRAVFFTEADVKFLSEVGFDHLRLPVDEEQMFAPDGGCPKSRIAPFAIVYFGKKYYLTVAKTKHYSNG